MGSSGIPGPETQGVPLRQRLFMWARQDIELLSPPAADRCASPTFLPRVLDRYPLPRSRAAWSTSGDGVAALLGPGLLVEAARAGFPPLLFLFVFCRGAWTARPDMVALFTAMLRWTRQELEGLYDEAFPPGGAVWCPLCSGPVHRPIDIASGWRAYGEEGSCRWCRRRVRPVGFAEAEKKEEGGRP